MWLLNVVKCGCSLWWNVGKSMLNQCFRWKFLRFDHQSNGGRWAAISLRHMYGFKMSWVGDNNRLNVVKTVLKSDTKLSFPNVCWWIWRTWRNLCVGDVAGDFHCELRRPRLGISKRFTLQDLFVLRSCVGWAFRYSGWWLGHPSEKYEFVNWDD